MKNRQDFLLGMISGCLAILIVFSLLFNVEIRPRWKGGASSGTTAGSKAAEKRDEKMFPKSGAILPIVWGNLGKKLLESGAIDEEKFLEIYGTRGGIGKDERELLYGENNGALVMTKQNASYILNLLWAFGLANSNPILIEGPMQDKKYGGASGFASTGGWIMAKGNPMNHYSAHLFIQLTEKQQQLVEKVAKNIYRPCCDNATYFPDCNHGMAMLGFLELMAYQNVSEEEMYKEALKLNTYWFPAAYTIIAQYMEKNGQPWEKVDPKKILGKEFSSSSGYNRILTQTQPQGSLGGGASCGV